MLSKRRDWLAKALDKLEISTPVPVIVDKGGFVVLCRVNGSGDYILATQELFEEITAAVKYASNCVNPTWKPLIAQILKKDEDSGADCGEVFGSSNGSPRM